MTDPVEQRVGSDVLRETAQGLELWTAAAMDDWQAGGHRRTLVRLAAGDYLVAGHRVVEDRHVYLLQPHDPGSLENPAGVVVYDADYVQQRDLQRRLQRAVDAGGPLLRLGLTLGSPLLGLLPSGVKLWLHARLGVHVTRATLHSLWAEMSVLMLALLFFAVDVWTGGQVPVPDGLRWFFLVAAIVVIPDGFVRTGRFIQGSLHQYGFYEWLFRRLDRP